MAVNRRGVALFVALVVVLLGGLVVVVATMAAAAEIRAGTAWNEQQDAAGLATSAAANGLPGLEAAFDSLAFGQVLAIDDTLRLTRLGDSTGLVSVAAFSRLGEESYEVIVRAAEDSLGGRRLSVPARSRVRYHPLR
jgi:hypothetical protein